MAHAEVKHDYHLVDPSPWPIVGSIGAFTMLIGAVFWMNKDYAFWGLPAPVRPFIFGAGVLLVAFTMFGWWRDVVQESVVRGDHTPVVKLGLRFGMVLFIASEVMFFVAWFWAYFNTALFPHDVSINQWPPNGIVTLDPWHFPLMNTLILLLSGTTVTAAHHAIQIGDRRGAIQGLLFTVLLGASFTCIQAYEYSHRLSRRDLRLDVLHGDGFSRLSCDRRHHLPNGVSLPSDRRPLHADAAFRLRGRSLVLAFRRRGLAVPLLLHLCLGRRRGNGLSEPVARSVARNALPGGCPCCPKGALYCPCNSVRAASLPLTPSRKGWGNSV
jgi:hypothetical protein